MKRNSNLFVQEGRSRIFTQNFELRFDIMSGLHNLYTMPLIGLYENEKYLNDGRFEFFVDDPQQYKINIEFGRPTGAEFRAMFHERLEWIAEQAFTPWSFEPKPRDVSNVDIVFSFSSAVTAVVFKLVWYDPI